VSAAASTVIKSHYSTNLNLRPDCTALVMAAEAVAAVEGNSTEHLDRTTGCRQLAQVAGVMSHLATEHSVEPIDDALPQSLR